MMTRQSFIDLLRGYLTEPPFAKKVSMVLDASGNLPTGLLVELDDGATFLVSVSAIAMIDLSAQRSGG